MSLFSSRSRPPEPEQITVTIPDSFAFRALVRLGAYAAPDAVVKDCIDAATLLLPLCDRQLVSRTDGEIEAINLLELDDAVREMGRIGEPPQDSGVVHSVVLSDTKGLRRLLELGEFPTIASGLETAMNILGAVLRLRAANSELGLLVKDEFVPIDLRLRATG